MGERTAAIERRGAALVAMVLLASLALILAACDGNGDRDADDKTDRELLARVSAVQRAGIPFAGTAIAYADLAAAREQLGLAADAGVSGGGKRRVLFWFAARPLFAVTTSGRLGARPGARRAASLGPLEIVLDPDRIEAVASTNLAFGPVGADAVYPWSVVALRTAQPFGEIAERLREQGYEDVDGLLLIAEPLEECCPPAHTFGRFPFPAAADAGEGVVVLGGSARAARAALDGAEAELTPAAELLAELPGVGRVGRGWRKGGRDGCLIAFGYGEDAQPRAGEARVLIDGQARADRALFLLDMHQLDGGPEIWFDAPAVEGGMVRVGYHFDSPLSRTWVTAERVPRPYDCAGEWRGDDPLSRVKPDADSGE